MRTKILTYGVAGLGLLVGWCTYQASTPITLIGGPTSGIVMEKGTGKPLPGAVVTAKWVGGYSGWSHGGNRCVKGSSTIADNSGRFRFPEWTKKDPGIENLAVSAQAYLPGYHVAQSGLGGVLPSMLLGFIPLGSIELSATNLRVEMEPFKGSPQERAETLSKFLMSTDCGDGEVGGMRTLYLAVRAEVQALPSAIRDFTENSSQASLLEAVEERYLSRTQ